MSLSEWGYQFEGPFSSPDQVPAKAGVYTVWCRQNSTWSSLDVGQAENMQERLTNHDRAICWKRHCGGSIHFYVVAMPSEAERRNLEQKIRQDKNPPCGEI